MKKLGKPSVGPSSGPKNRKARTPLEMSARSGSFM
jgi:hypothetical protein